MAATGTRLGRAGRALLVAAALAAGCAPAAAGNDCSSSVSGAQDSGRQTFLNGMLGLASNNFSGRPASFTSMACLDKFMSGNMDIMFKPPSINDLLGQVMNFACQSSGSQSTSGSTPNISSLIGSLSGGLNLGGSSGSSGGLTNLASMMSSLFGGSSSTSSGTAGNGGLASIFSGSTSAYSSGSSSYYDTSSSGTSSSGFTQSGTNTGATSTPGGGGYQSQGANPGLDSKLLQGHAIKLPGN